MKNCSVILLIVLFSVFLSLEAIAQAQRNLLTSEYSRKFVSASTDRGQAWAGYPAYSDRKAWDRLPDDLRVRTIQEGEKFLGFDWPLVKATMYLEFTRSGDRTKDAEVNNARRKALQSLVLAELMEGKGRFLDDIINGVFAFCEQTYWGASAHFYLYGFDGTIAKPTTVLPDIDDPIIDLVVGDVASDLAWTFHFFKEAFDEVSPVISKRLKSEITKKVLEPFYERYDFWWITGWGEGRVNNWTPWVNYNILTCILLVEEDPIKQNDGIYKTMESVDLFINSYPDDGSCSEGPGYWAHAGGKMFDYLDLLHKNTDGAIDLFDRELIKNMGRYIYRAYISNGEHYINFADSPFRIRHNPGRIYRYGQRINDETMVGFGVFLMDQSEFKISAISGKLGEALENLFNVEGWQSLQGKEPLIAEYYFIDLDAVIARDEEGTDKGFYFAAKGGSNGEQHNHNDVGSFMLYYNGNPVFMDVGVGTYTRETFGPERYSIWTMQSNYHNLPVINGLGQRPGGGYKASDSSYNPSKGKVTYSTNIAGAYPDDAKVKSWERTYTLDRKKRFLIEDSFELLENTGETAFHFMTGLPGKVVRAGLVELVGNGFTIQVRYDQENLYAKIEPIRIADNRLKQNHGDEIYRLVFNWKSNNKAGDHTFEIGLKP
ncbi:heparinase II/III family protein [Cyclobacterium sp.]|uniref:heparinase II/III domain-containing protein n=1 Tax=Cyclobacterium sp. TaxID=1966343 RepID=UPI00199F962D|nr:heparinase II/III family protein [Cyclobacterium sp.]MBD3629382.1 heparinase II/III-family protein [Cyclobacterium sp.]